MPEKSYEIELIPENHEDFDDAKKINDLVKDIKNEILKIQDIIENEEIIENNAETRRYYEDFIVKYRLRLNLIRWLFRHEVEINNSTVQKIEKYKFQFEQKIYELENLIGPTKKYNIIDEIKKYQGFIDLLDWMKMISDNELQLINWTIVKTWYPDMQPDWKEIFEQVLEDWTRWIFVQQKWRLKKFLKEELKKWYRIAWKEMDVNWEVFKKEMMEIFECFPGKWSEDWNNIIRDILGISWAGSFNPNWTFNEQLTTNFWSNSTCLNNQVNRNILDCKTWKKNEYLVCSLNAFGLKPVFETTSGQNKYKTFLFSYNNEGNLILLFKKPQENKE